MVKIKKYANVVERFLHGEKGQRFFNFAYSIGAAIVIWGALFKILHLPGGSTLLCIGMGTEIAMFILTAFDRPPKEYSWEDVFPVLDKKGDHHVAGGLQMPAGGYPGAITAGEYPGGVPQSAAGAYPGGQGVPGVAATSGAAAEEGSQFAPAAGGYYPATATYASPSEQAQNALGLSEEETEQLRESASRLATVSEQLASITGMAEATTQYLEQINGIASQMQRLQETTRALNDVSETLLQSYQLVSGAAKENSESGYAEQMQDLTRNISGLNTIYSIQLKSISSQLESIDRVNRGLKDIRDMYEKSAHDSSRYCEETEKMARYMKQLNSVYEKMITAMTINMANPLMGGGNPYAISEEQQQPSSTPRRPASAE